MMTIGHKKTNGGRSKGSQGAGAPKKRVRSKFALPRRDEFQRRSNAAVSYVEKLHGPLESHPEKKQLTGSFAMPTVTYQDLNVDSELPAPDRFLPLWTDDYHPQPTTTQREEHYPVQSLECLGITDRRTKKEPPRVAQLTVFCNDQPPATDRQYIWCYSKDPAHKRRGSHPPGNGYQWNDSQASFENFPYTPSMTPLQMMTGHGQNCSHLHSVSLKLLPGSRETSQMEGASLGPSRNSSRLHQTTDTTGSETNLDCPALHQPTLPGSLAFIRRMRSAHRHRYPSSQKLEDGVQAVNVQEATLSNSSLSSTALHHSRRVRRQTVPPKWKYHDLAFAEDEHRKETPVYEKPPSGTKPVELRGSKVPAKERAMVLPSVAPDFTLSDHAVPLPSFLQKLMNKASDPQQQKPGETMGKSKTTSDEAKADAPTEIFGSDLYLMAPAAANSPTPAEFKSQWMETKTEASPTDPGNTGTLATAGESYLRPVAFDDRASSVEEPYSRQSTGLSFASVSLPLMSPMNDSAASSPFASPLRGNNSAGTGISIQSQLTDPDYWLERDKLLLSKRRDRAHIGLAQRQITPIAPNSTPIMDSLDLATAYPLPPAPSPVMGYTSGITPLEIPSHILNDHVIDVETTGSSPASNPTATPSKLSSAESQATNTQKMGSEGESASSNKDARNRVFE